MTQPVYPPLPVSSSSRGVGEVALAVRMKVSIVSRGVGVNGSEKGDGCKKVEE